MLISIITVTRNDLDGLKATEASLRLQSNQFYEWIVVDGQSEDDTANYMSSCNRCNKFISEIDDGIYDAMRKGLLLANGKYVAFLNSGDLLEATDALDRLIADLSSEYDVYFYDTLIVSKHSSYVRLARPMESVNYSVPAVQQSTIYLKSMLQKINWPLEYKICGDYALMVRLYKLGAKGVVVRRSFSKFSLGGVSTNKFLKLAKEAFIIQVREAGVGYFMASLYFIRRLLTGVVVYILSR